MQSSIRVAEAIPQKRSRSEEPKIIEHVRLLANVARAEGQEVELELLQALEVDAPLLLRLTSLSKT